MPLLFLGLAAWSCEDPGETFNPTNPNLSSENVIGTIESATRTLNGAERQLALLMNEIHVPAEVASDNYTNTKTFFNQFLDNLDINPTDADMQALAFDISLMRELTTTGIDEIGPGDADYTDEQRAGFHFLRGASYMVAGELFNTLPGEAGGAALPAADHLNLAIADFTTAIGAAPSSDYGIAALIARARTYYRLGDRTNAVADATAAITAGPDFVYFTRFDGANVGGADNNTMQDALFDRGSFDDLQPLPTLDFLDPKYNGSIPSVETNAPFIKIEEAHLILAEAELSQGNLDNAKNIMKDIVALVATRPLASFDDGVEGRAEDVPGSRPDAAVVMVAAGPDRPLQAGLVIGRGAGDISVSVVSGTHYTDDEIDAIADIDFGYESLYRMRQEIFIAEGRRMTDMGIRFVVSQVEKDSNPLIQDSDLEPVIPSFFAAIRMELDDFTYDADAGTARVAHNVNRLISENRGSDLVAPFE